MAGSSLRRRIKDGSIRAGVCPWIVRHNRTALGEHRQELAPGAFGGTWRAPRSVGAELVVGGTLRVGVDVSP